jgi:hypothetical protein
MRNVTVLPGIKVFANNIIDTGTDDLVYAADKVRERGELTAID